MELAVGYYSTQHQHLASSIISTTTTTTSVRSNYAGIILHLPASLHGWMMDGWMDAEPFDFIQNAAQIPTEREKQHCSSSSSQSKIPLLQPHTTPQQQPWHDQPSANQ
jgi:hypothetical protein